MSNPPCCYSCQRPTDGTSRCVNLATSSCQIPMNHAYIAFGIPMNSRLCCKRMIATYCPSAVEERVAIEIRTNAMMDEQAKIPMGIGGTPELHALTMRTPFQIKTHAPKELAGQLLEPKVPLSAHIDKTQMHLFALPDNLPLLLPKPGIRTDNPYQ